MMKKQLITALLFLTCCVPLALADNVTIHGTTGMLEADLVTKTGEKVGVVQVFNTAMDMNVVVLPDTARALVSKVYIFLDIAPAPPPIPQELLDQLDAAEDALTLDPENTTLLADYNVLLEELGTYAANYGEWLYTKNFKKDLQSRVPFSIALSEFAGLQWGQWGEPWLQQRLVTVAARVELKTADKVPVTFDAWALNPNVPLELQRTGWGDNALAMRYELQHPKHGQFTGVHGLTYLTPTHYGQTGTDGSFAFFPGEDVSFWIGNAFIGTATASQRVSPLDVFPGQEITDIEVINMARLLLSLDPDYTGNGPIVIHGNLAALLPNVTIDFTNIEGLPIPLVSEAVAEAWLENNVGNLMFRRNVSKTELEYDVDKPKLDIIPVYVPAKTASGLSTTVVYKDEDGNLLDEPRDLVKPLIITYTEQQKPNTEKGILRSGSDVMTAVSTDDGATWKRFNVSHMANHSSFTLEANGERFPGDSRGPQQKIYGENILIVWTSAYARGGKPSFSIKTDDDYPWDDPYAVFDVWGVRGRQGSVNYNEDKDVGDQGIGEIPYYAVWACRGVLVYEGNASQFPDRELGEIVWFKPERLTSGRRDAFFVMSARSKEGFAVVWQEDPGGLLPGTLKGGGDGWSGATVHKKTDIWYSFIKMGDFALIDENFVPSDHAQDEFGEVDDHSKQPEISNRPKSLVPMSLAVRVSDNNTVNTENLKVQLDPVTGLPIPGYIPIEGALEEDFLASEHETEGGCDDGDTPDDGHEGNNGTGGGWGMARYAYLLPLLGLADVNLPSDVPVWDQDVAGDYRPSSGLRWTRFINKAGMERTVLVTADGRALDGDTGACRPHLNMMSGGWVILGYEETKGLGFPPEGDHEDEGVERPEPDDSGKNVIYHSFKFDKPDMVSAGDVLNLPALDDNGNLIPIYYRDAAGNPTSDFRQYKTENARRFRSIAQPKGQMGATKTSMVALYKQGREGSGKPSDIMAIRAVVPNGDTGNPYRFSLLQRYETGATTNDPNVMRFQRRHQNMTSATVESMDPVLTASDNEGNTWNKVGKWKQYEGNMSDESFANPYSDAKGHRGFIRGDNVVIGYSFTPNWGRLGGDHMDFFVRRSFNGGQTWTTDPGGSGATHTVIERDPQTGEYSEKQYSYGAGQFEPGRNVSLLKGNSHTIVDPRLVPPMGEGSTINPKFPQDDLENTDVYYVTFGTAKVLHGLGEPLGVTDTIKEDLFYTRTTDDGETWLQVPWVINPDSSSPDAGETVYRWPWLAQGDPHQGHAQIRTHPGGNRFYAIWHQWTDGDEAGSPNNAGNDIWFRRIDFME